MKTRNWKKEIDEALKGKISEALKSFEVQRDADIKKLIQLSEQLHDFTIKKEVCLGQQKEEGLKFMPKVGTQEQLRQKISYFEKNIRGFQKQIDELFKKLTTVDKSIESNIPFILKLVELNEGKK